MKKIFFILIFWLLVYGSFLPQYKKVLTLNYKETKLPFGLTRKTVVQEPKVAIVLSGGGARALAQIGVLKALSSRNIPINYIVGTSMGSIIGGLYSCGYNVHDLDSISEQIPWNDLVSLGKESSRKDLFVDQKITEDRAIFSLRIEGLHLVIPTSINTGQRFSSYLNLLVLNAPIHINSRFDELMYNFKAVCTDLVTGKAVVLEEGSLSQAMRASSSFSPVVSPVTLDSMLLVDGGLVANIPVQFAKNLGSDYVIAFNTTSPLNTVNDLAYPWNVADQIVSIPMRILTDQQLKNADIVIKPDLGYKRNTDFTGIDSIINIGYVTTLPLLDKIKNNLKQVFINKFKGEEYFIKNPVFNESAKVLNNSFINKYFRKDSVSR